MHHDSLKRPGLWACTRRLVRLTASAGRPESLCLICLILVSGFCSGYLLFTFGAELANAMQRFAAGREDKAAVLALTLAVGGFASFLMLMNSVRGYLSESLWMKVQVSIQIMFATGISEHSVESLEQERHQRRLEIARSNIHRLLRHVERLFNLLEIGATLAGLSMFVSLTEWWLGLVLLLGLFLRFRMATKIAGRLFFTEVRLVSESRHSGLIRWFLSSVNQLRELKLLGKVEEFLGRMQRMLLAIDKERLATSRRNLRTGIASRMLEQAVLLAIAIYAAKLFIEGSIDLGTCLAIGGAARMMNGELSRLDALLSQTMQDAPFIVRAFRVLDEAPKDRTVTQCGKGERLSLQNGMPEIRFQSVSYRYPLSDRWAIRNVSFVIRAGELLGVVGRNGSGKSTLIHLIAGLYAPTEGRILVGGVDLQEINQVWWREQLAVQFQTWTIFISLTARESIALGHPSSAEGLPVEEAARMSGASAFIEAWPHSYEQVLGSEFRGGRQLSGGEGQLLSLARIFSRQAKLLVLDEPTSALDPQNERRIIDAVSGSVPGTTRVFITHRYANASIAERVLVLDQGEVADLGTHEELMQRCALYRENFKAQCRQPN